MDDERYGRVRRGKEKRKKHVVCAPPTENINNTRRRHSIVFFFLVVVVVVLCWVTTICAAAAATANVFILFLTDSNRIGEKPATSCCCCCLSELLDCLLLNLESGGKEMFIYSAFLMDRLMTRNAQAEGGEIRHFTSIFSRCAHHRTPTAIEALIFQFKINNFPINIAPYWWNIITDWYKNIYKHWFFSW